MIKQKLIMAFAFFCGMCVLTGCGTSQPTAVTANNTIMVTPEAPVEIVIVADTLGPKRITFIVDNLKSYANLSLYQGTKLLADNLNVPVQGEQVISALVDVGQTGEISLSLRTLNAQVNILSWHVDDVEFSNLPQFEDITETAGLDKVTSLKYGGPSVADLDQDGDYDLVLNNHNAETSKIYLNNGDGTVVKYHTDLSRWFMQDLHGTALGDYDRDGD